MPVPTTQPAIATPAAVEEALLTSASMLRSPRMFAAELTACYRRLTPN
jgi:hypothetical protein